jgi:hypothetical protein
VLRHDLADGSHHFDWLIAPNAKSPLLTFRSDRPLHALAPGESTPVERLNDHRRVYLTYEGPISGGRGTVRRVAGGEVTACEPGENGLILRLRWENGPDVQLVWLKLDGSSSGRVISVASAPSNR